MKNFFYTFSFVISLFYSAVSFAKAEKHFCFDGDIPEAQMDFSMMCITAPILICPSGYYGCPSDSTDPTNTGTPIAIPGDPNCPAAIITYTDIVVSNTSCLVEIHRKWHAEYPPGVANPWLYSECMQIIINEDTEAPAIISCPSDVVIDLAASCDSTAVWTAPTAVDDCGLVSLTSSHASGDTFTSDTTQVVYTAIDSCGNQSNCSFNVIVTGTCCALDTIICPPDIALCPDTSSLDPAISGYAIATSTDTSCMVPVMTYSDSILTSGPCPGAMEVLRTWTATNPFDSTQTLTCNQAISLIDTIAPIITGMPSDITVFGSGSACSVPVTWTEPIAVDSCSLSLFGSNIPNGSQFSEGLTTVTYIAVDGCGNQTTASFTVEVQCSNAACASNPIISCPPNYWACPQSQIPLPAVSGYASAVAGEPGCDQPSIAYTDLIVSSGPCAGAKIIERTWTAFDPNDPAVASTCVQLISLEDTSPPAFNYCPSDVTVSATNSNCSAAVNWTLPSIVDNCGITSLNATDQTGSYVHPGDLFYQGTTTVTYTAVDVCGLYAQCSFDIEVQCQSCTTPPTIYCPADAYVCIGDDISPTQLGMAISTGGANCPVPSVIFEDWVISTGPCPGQKLIKRIWTASYPGIPGLQTSCDQYIHIEDDYGPVIYNCPNNITAPLSNNNVYWQSPWALDDCSSVSLSSNYSPGYAFPLGTTTVIYTAVDGCGNASYCTFNVTIYDDQMSLDCPNDIYASCGTNGGAYVDWNPPVLNGSCGDCNNGHYIPGFIYMGSYNGHQYYCSTSPDTWLNAKANCEANGGYLASINSAGENAFLANILTLQSAWIGLSDHISEGNFQWTNGDPLSYTNWYPNQPNNYGGSQDYVELLNSGKWNDQYNTYSLEYIMELPCSSVYQISGPAPGSFLSGGNYTVVYGVNNACGANLTCSFNIFVDGGLSLTCPDDIDLTVLPTASGAVVTWDPPVAETCCSSCNNGGAYIPGFVYMGSLNGHHYYCSTSPDTWPNAQATCEANGGNLAIINSAAENAYLAGLLTLQSAYIGLSDAQTEGTFEWVNGDPVNYTNWYPGQPNNYGGVQDYVELLNTGEWNDQYNYTALEYIMEISDCVDITQTSGPANGSFLSAGSTHTVSYTATDGCGNVENCSFQITLSPNNINLPCNSGGELSAEYYIDSVVFGQINNTSGDNGGYEDYTSICTVVDAGVDYPIYLNPGFGSSFPDKVYWKVWIDYNFDGDYDDSQELVAYGCGESTLSGTITMPQNLLPGKTTMRIAMSLFRYPLNACEVFGWGESEDYCINIITTKAIPSGIAGFNKNIRPEAVILEQVQNIGLEVYPNPADRIMTIYTKNPDELVQLDMISVDGRIVHQISNNAITEKTQIDVTNFVAGSYFVRTIDKFGNTEFKTIMIQH